MLPQFAVEAPQNGTNPDRTSHDKPVDTHDRALTWEQTDDQALRDDPAIRAQMCKLVPELGGLIRAHARQLGERTGEDCPFQVDDHAEALLWQLIEFLSQSACDRDYREGSVKAHQLTKAHAAYHFDWPPVTEGEVE